MFSEGIFEGETLIGYSYTKPTSRIILPFITPKAMAYDIHLKVFFHLSNYYIILASIMIKKHKCV